MAPILTVRTDTRTDRLRNSEISQGAAKWIRAREAQARDNNKKTHRPNDSAGTMLKINSFKFDSQFLYSSYSGRTYFCEYNEIY